MAASRARVDLDAGCIEWVDQPGCACGDALQLQAIDDFLNAGPIEPVPADVLEEMQTELARYRTYS